VALAAQVVASINELLSVGLSEILDKVQAFLATHFSGIADALHLPVESLRDGALSLAKRLGSGLAAWAGDLASALPGQFVDTFLFLIAVYYFLRDGTALVAWLMRLSPFQAHDTDELFASIRETVAGSIVGQLATSLVQGGLTLIALWLFNVPGALVFGLVATLLSILPMVGTTPITLGAVLYLLASGRNGAAIGMAVAALIIGTSDNIVRPWVQSSQTKMHPLITLLAIFGGISALGLAGVFLGPVIAAMAIWTFEFSAKLRRREASPPPASA
jgi:predicted PurR-regulated permease PerM